MKTLWAVTYVTRVDREEVTEWRATKKLAENRWRVLSAGEARPQPDIYGQVSVGPVTLPDRLSDLCTWLELRKVPAR